jgi:ParB family chromosome partitioning protein
LNRKSGLGKGLDALIPSLNIRDDEKVVEIALTQLRPNPYQPRKTFDDESIRELAESIKEHGVIQPIIVREVLKGYEIIAGERRFRASQLAGKPTIPAVVKSFTDQQVMEIALIENLQREDLNAMEIAAAYQNLIDTFQLTQEELAAKVGKSRSHIANFLRLLSLPAEIKEYVSRGTLSMGHARAIISIENPKVQKELAKKAINENWSVRQLEQTVQQMQKSKKPAAKKTARKTDPFIASVEEELRDLLQTTVRVRHEKNRGKIEISYYSLDDFERLLGLLKRKEA